MIVEAVVKPNSKNFSVKYENSKLHVSLTEQAEKNKANIELLKELAKLLHCEVRIVSGLTSKRKKLELGISEAELHSLLPNK
ncbi:MAG: DUF167 family protein [Candidatus Micrarchaeia archaeon]|jgi:uncharacterized protein (TIGR00251 family)